MIEKLLKPRILKNYPPYIFLFSFFATLLGFIFSLLIFGYAKISVIAVLMTALILVPTLSQILSWGAKLEAKGRNIFAKQLKIVQLYVYLFVGSVIAYALIALLLPPFAKQLFFADQFGFFQPNIEFGQILVNNIGVLTLSYVFAFVSGAGAIVILLYNSSLFGLLLGHFIFNPIFLPHAIIELIAYLIVAFAGGLVSEAVVEEEFGSKRFKRIVKTSLKLFLLALALIVLGAYIETKAIAIAVS